MVKLFETAADLGGHLFRILDNGGATMDRYTMAFSDGDCLTLSRGGRGVSMWGYFDPLCLQEEVDSGAAVDLAWGDLDEDTRQHVLSRCNEDWHDYLEAGMEGESWAVAESRDKAEENEGGARCGGVGIYKANGQYFVAHDSGPDYDRGPFDNFREALLASLPDECDLSGPEYQSTALGNGGDHTEESHPEIQAMIKALEARVDAGHEAEAG